MMFATDITLCNCNFLFKQCLAVPYNLSEQLIEQTQSVSLSDNMYLWFTKVQFSMKIVSFDLTADQTGVGQKCNCVQTICQTIMDTSYWLKL